MPVTNDEKLVEQIFNGALAILAVLVAVAGVVAAGYDKISGLPDVEPRFRYFLWAAAVLAIVACSLSLLALERLRGHAIPIGLILLLARLLMIGAALASVGIVIITTW
jgi:hypothetical protein